MNGAQERESTEHRGIERTESEFLLPLPVQSRYLLPFPWDWTVSIPRPRSFPWMRYLHAQLSHSRAPGAVASCVRGVCRRAGRPALEVRSEISLPRPHQDEQEGGPHARRAAHRDRERNRGPLPDQDAGSEVRWQ